jgi:Fic family protein
MPLIEAPSRIEPARLEEPTEAITDVVAELSAAAAVLARALHPRTASNLAALVRLINAYYSNLIEGRNTRPRDIERALAGQFDADTERRNLQLEAAAHVRVQAEVDAMAATGHLPEPASKEFILWLHREFYRDAPPEMLLIRDGERQLVMAPGSFRSQPEHDVAVGRHAPPSSDRVLAFMDYFEDRYRMDRMGKAGRIISMAAAHHPV